MVHCFLTIDYSATYIYWIGNMLISQDTPPNTWPQYTLIWAIGHEGKKMGMFSTKNGGNSYYSFVSASG